ncbi:uncharacterized protein K452DRAFT_302042 [Aplosporella prunicola CBS 121167]|uniref:Uncharacterized protein n=1 Tax=Aplosporella prunicola CBS 121167 TaxID=1176127 RepID=A0A6A6AZR9_9PEZI|nr:uncharacterized protein K452DRAFT_302042 [Aplosporella prunicola CBS 121167]KAF2137280.1 hypothetical protein K452DRAFT_302042 [Aplosporella prunicola CBS 121167]
MPIFQGATALTPASVPEYQAREAPQLSIPFPRFLPQAPRRQTVAPSAPTRPPRTVTDQKTESDYTSSSAGAMRPIILLAYRSKLNLQAQDAFPPPKVTAQQ